MLVPQVADGNRLNPASDTRMRGSPHSVPEMNQYGLGDPGCVHSAQYTGDVNRAFA
jgi:hypothetical protein